MQSGPERRQLTVLFCDLVGSTALAHELDPEDLRELMARYQTCTGEVIARYEGFTARYVGDGILVYFGFPRAHEDDAARAVHTGLDIVEAIEKLTALPGREDVGRLGVRIGIATGLVVVGDLIGEGASEQAVAIGETPNLAARLQALATPNTVVVSEATRALAGGAFEYADRGLQAVKGLSEPVRAWRVMRTSPAELRFDAARSRRLTSLVAREHEVETLLRYWQRAVDGEGRLILLVGEAGIGKSRLAEALSERIADLPHSRVRYQCSPYHANSALHPFIHQLERAAELRREDSNERKLDKLEALLARSTTGTAESVPLYAALLSLSTAHRYPDLQLTPQQLKDRTLAALIDGLASLAAQAPLLVIVEDVHWIDPTSSELLGQLALRAVRLPILVVATSRPGAEYAWLDAKHASTLRLERFDREQSRRMVSMLLEGTEASAEWIEQIAARTDGVPLFIEELTKTVVSGLAGADPNAVQMLRSTIPSTLKDSLMARLDPLGPAKEIAQVGAVIGREFTRELVAAASDVPADAVDAALHTLIASGIVFVRSTVGPAAYVFKHALVQDAAYASLLRGRRQAFHSRIADMLTKTYPERASAEPELIAHHRTDAGEPLPAARYWALAAQRALDRSANVEALGHANKGLEVLRGAEACGPRDALELALEILGGAAYRAVSGFASSDAERCFARARELSERLGDVPRLIDARRGLFSCYYARGALALAKEQGAEVAMLGQRVDDSGSRMLGHWMVGCIMFWQGEHASARDELERAFSLYDPNVQRGKTLALQIDPGVNALLHLSWLRWILGLPDQAIATSEAAIDTARRLSQPFAVAMALFFACATRACCGQRLRVRPLLDELFALTAEHKLRYLGSCAVVLEAQEAIAEGRYDAGLQQIRQAFSEFQAQEAGVGFPWVMSIAATAHAGLGRIDDGLAALSAGFDAVAHNGEHHWEAELWRLRGELLLLADVDEAEAERAFRRAAEVAAGQAAKSLELRATTSLARLLARQGRNDDARELLQKALAWFDEGLDTMDIQRATLAAPAPR